MYIRNEKKTASALFASEGTILWVPTTWILYAHRSVTGAFVARLSTHGLSRSPLIFWWMVLYGSSDIFGGLSLNLGLTITVRQCKNRSPTIKGNGNNWPTEHSWVINWTGRKLGTLFLLSLPLSKYVVQKVKFYIAPLLIHIFELQDPKYKFSKNGE